MDRPNLLLITTDQQRFDTIHALGNRYIHTPHLNWLVDEGLTFTRCYADSPICMASRATLMTGLPGYASGLVSNSVEPPPMATHPTLPGLLTAHGYQTRAQGKMHFHPMRANYGFEHMELPMDYYRERHRQAHTGLPKEHGIGENEIEPVISTVDETHSLTYWTVTRSIDFLETRDESRPFFLWTSFAKPHPPWDPCRNYWELYRDRPMPPSLRGDWSADVNTMPQGWLGPTYSLNNAWRMDEEALAQSKRAYYACITQIDYNLGLLFARMRELGLLENTWIVFTTDHGDMLGDHHLGAKSVFFEGSAHLPLIIRPPAGPWAAKPHAATRCDDLCELADIMPTLLAIAGVAAPAHCPGVDLRGLIGQPRGRTLYGNCGHRFFQVREGDYKYTWCAEGDSELLFDLAADPGEQHDLIAAGTASAAHVRLRAKLLEHLAATRSPRLADGRLAPLPVRPRDQVPRWPGFHSTVVNADVLH
jgi:arylsulfatase A-like enzyme